MAPMFPIHCKILDFGQFLSNYGNNKVPFQYKFLKTEHSCNIFIFLIEYLFVAVLKYSVAFPTLREGITYSWLNLQVHVSCNIRFIYGTPLPLRTSNKKILQYSCLCFIKKQGPPSVTLLCNTDSLLKSKLLVQVYAFFHICSFL